MANRLSWMPLAPEMNSFQTEIGGNQQLVTSGDFEDAAIIANARGYPLPSGGSFADARDQQVFCERHDEPNI